eukprot:9062769-Alexandrium_andersonii.AAC.1
MDVGRAAPDAVAPGRPGRPSHATECLGGPGCGATLPRSSPLGALSQLERRRSCSSGLAATPATPEQTI